MGRRFWRDESGATSIEYAMIASMVSIVIYAAVKSIGLNLSAHYFAPVAANLR